MSSNKPTKQVAPEVDNETKDKLNEKLIELDDLKSKLEKLQIDFDELKAEYTWLSRNYSNMISQIYNEIDEMAYRVKHSNLRELLQSREEEKQKAIEQKPNS